MLEKIHKGTNRSIKYWSLEVLPLFDTDVLNPGGRLWRHSSTFKLNLHSDSRAICVLNISKAKTSQKHIFK